VETRTETIIEGQYLRDILDQPRALTATLANLEIPKELSVAAQRLRKGEFKRIVLTGMGASFHALYPTFLRLNAAGYTGYAIDTSELVYSLSCWLAPDTLIIAVSQSGESGEVVRLLENNRGRASVVGVTNAADSSLALQANASIITMAGPEFSVSCKTYVTALMALHLIGEFLCGGDASLAREELAQVVRATASYLNAWKEHVLEMSSELDTIRTFFLLGRGPSLAACGDGALIVKESVRLHAEGMSGAAFRHGPLEMVDDRTCAVVFAGEENTRALQARLYDDVRKARGKAFWIAENARPGPWNLPTTPASVRHILEILPLQMMTLALAAEAGIEAGRFARISKVTTTE
jgi:glucosamine--fructose-6-phosphate aminotransferase (isomerizing)